ncbi:hypothetical protein BGW37DRAFT_115979 [Umbelopsis sp. PMI_123]|nr:hypothetical protein BGW37DRAFT_115979 [Umbelopsis sp. PMI_123]
MEVGTNQPEPPKETFDDYMDRLNKQSQQLSQQLDTILKQQQQENVTTDDDEASYSTSSPIPERIYQHSRQRVTSFDSQDQQEPGWRLVQRRQQYRSHSVPSMQAPNHDSTESSRTSDSEASNTGSGTLSDDESSPSQSDEYNPQQMIPRRGSWDPMQPAPFEARIQQYDRHPHIRTQSGPSSAGPMMQQHSTVLGFTQPPPPAMMYAEPMPADIPMIHPPMMFGPPPPPPPPPPMGVPPPPPEFMGMPNGDSGVMTSAMLADAMMEVPPPMGPPGHDMVPFQGPGDMDNFQPPPAAIDHYQQPDSKPSAKPLPRPQRMVAAIKQRLGRAAQKQSIRYGMISQRMFEPPPPSSEANVGGLSRQSSLARRRSVRQGQAYANRDKPDAMMWCFRPQRRLSSPPWEPFDPISQATIMEAATQNQQCLIQDSHFPQMINVVPSGGYAVCRKVHDHVVYNVAFLDPTKQSRTFLYCIPISRRRRHHHRRNPSHLQ